MDKKQANTDKKLADIVVKELKGGAYLKDALKKAKISYTKWRALTTKLKIKIKVPKGKKQITYNLERVKEVQKRIKQGQFLHEITKDMGMDPNNLARYCRYNGIKLFSKAAMAANYKRRVYKGGRRKGQKSRAPQVIKMLEQGKPHTVIADKLKISRQYVSHIKRQENEKAPATKKSKGKKK